MGMGVGQPPSMKLKNVHLPHPHPNGGLSDSFHGGGVALSLFLAAIVVGDSEVTTAEMFLCFLYREEHK